MAEPARAAPMSPPSGGAAGRPPASRSPALGLVALLLAFVVIVATLVSPFVVSALGIRLMDVQLLGAMLTGEAIGMAVVLLLAVIAVVTRRGRGPGIAAAVIALLVNPFALSLPFAIGRLVVPSA